MKVQQNYSLKELNTFGIEAKATYFTQFESEAELLSILKDKEYQNLPLLVLGGGSNILLSKDFEGLALLNKIKGIEIVNEDKDFVYLKSGGGEVWHDLVLYTIDKNLGGIENLSLIPGSVGASPIQNIGAYGVELKDAFHSLEAIEIKTGHKKVFTIQECQFGYRNSIFKTSLKGQYIITSVTLQLRKKPVFNTSYGAIQSTLEEMGVQTLSVKAISDAVIHIRRSKLPDPAEIGNAGSFFKNPEIPEEQFIELQKKYPEIPCYKTVPGMVKVPAGWLNEQCGWKGKTIGKAGVHKNQALVLVNYGGAKGSEIKDLAIAIQQSVKEKFGIGLEMEVNLI
ncbi:MAG TPA: UDP-N-acetylmuramate dehydrogenase [Cytophagaceae bacterium]